MNITLSDYILTGIVQAQAEGLTIEDLSQIAELCHDLPYDKIGESFDSAIQATIKLKEIANEIFN